MKRPSLFNHEKRITAIERALDNRVWWWTAVGVLTAAVLMLAYVVTFGDSLDRQLLDRGGFLDALFSA